MKLLALSVLDQMLAVLDVINFSEAPQVLMACRTACGHTDSGNLPRLLQFQLHTYQGLKHQILTIFITKRTSDFPLRQICRVYTKLLNHPNKGIHRLKQTHQCFSYFGNGWVSISNIDHLPTNPSI